MKVYNIIFYHIHLLSIATGGEKGALMKTIYVFSFLQGLNLIELFILMDIFGLASIENVSKIYTIVTYGILILLNLIYLKPNDKYKSIENYYLNKLDIKTDRSGKWVLTYAILSVILLFVLAPLRV
jgi:hypothetical protein